VIDGSHNTWSRIPVDQTIFSPIIVPDDEGGSVRYRRYVVIMYWPCDVSQSQNLESTSCCSFIHPGSQNAKPTVCHDQEISPSSSRTMRYPRLPRALLRVIIHFQFLWFTSASCGEFSGKRTVTASPLRRWTRNIAIAIMPAEGRK